MAVERNHHILMRYRGASEDRERALSSGGSAVKDFLEQFEGDDRVAAALEIASELGPAIQDEIDGEDESAVTATFYAAEMADTEMMQRLVEGVDSLRWIAGVAGVAEHMHNPVNSSGN